MTFTRFSNSAQGGNNLIQKSALRANQQLFSGFMVATLGFSGTTFQDFSRFFVLDAAQAATIVEEQKSPVASGEPVIDDNGKPCLSKKDHPVVDSLPLYVEKTNMPERDLFYEQCVVYTGETAERTNEEDQFLEARIDDLAKMTKGHPIADMAQEIAKLDPEIAALVVGIAKKESNWGKRSPKKQRTDCFNYWGFKGAGERGVGMGHACFATREEAVQKISKRLERLVEKRGTSKPSALVTTWKCGQSCASHSKESVSKWVSDVNQYYSKVLAME